MGVIVVFKIYYYEKYKIKIDFKLSRYNILKRYFKELYYINILNNIIC